MTEMPPRELFTRFCQSLSASMGLHFPESQWQTLERKLKSALEALPFSSVTEMISSFTSSPMQRKHVEILASHLTIGETFFFRDEKCFEALQFQILLPLIRKRREEGNPVLRLWSAGCATGEEPYSLAILLRRILPDLADWNVTILATDINPRFLRKAEAGCYTKWSFRSAPPWVRDQYFEPQGDHQHRIRESVRKMVQFQYLNLAEDAYPNLLNNTNAMDVIFCRNVLMYFTPHLLETVMERLHRSLVDKGWLCVSPVEAPLVSHAGLKPKRVPGVSLYRKESVRDKEEEKPWEGWTKERLPEDNTALPTTAEREDSRVSLEIPPGLRTAPVSTPGTGVSPVSNSEEFGQTRAAGKEKEPPGNGEAGFREALKHYDTGRYGEAERLLLSLREAGVEPIRVGTLMCRVLANQGRLDEAEAWCLKTLDLERTNACLYFILSTILEEKGKTDAAVGALKKALYADPDFTLAHFALGNAMIRKDRRKESRRHFRNALKCLGGSKPDDIVPESEGITAGRFSEIIRSMMQML